MSPKRFAGWLVVLTTTPELLVALGVGAGVIRVMVSLAGVLVELFPDKKGVGGIGAEGRPTGLPEPEGESADGSRSGLSRGVASPCPSRTCWRPGFCRGNVGATREPLAR